MFRRVLHPTDGSAAATRAAETLAELLSQIPDVSVTLAVVVQPLNADDTDYEEDVVERQNAHMRSRAEQTLARTAAIFEKRDIKHEIRIVEGDPVSQAIAREAEAGSFDVIAMGSRGLGMQKNDLHYLGSVTERVIRKVGIPVLVIPARVEH